MVLVSPEFLLGLNWTLIDTLSLFGFWTPQLIFISCNKTGSLSQPLLLTPTTEPLHTTSQGWSLQGLSTVCFSVCMHIPSVITSMAWVYVPYKLVTHLRPLSKIQTGGCPLDITLWMSSYLRLSNILLIPHILHSLWPPQLLPIPSFYLVRSETLDSSLTFCHTASLSTLPGKPDSLIFRIHRESATSTAMTLA